MSLLHTLPWGSHVYIIKPLGGNLITSGAFRYFKDFLAFVVVDLKVLVVVKDVMVVVVAI